MNDSINVLSADNQARIRAELVRPNVVFGLHRWYSAGSSPSPVALSSERDLDAELSRGRPGDNLVLVSLRRVGHRALAHVVLGSDLPVPLPSRVQDQLLDFLRDPHRELAVVHRHDRDDGHFECAYDVVWDPTSEDWSEQLERWSRSQGELFFFDDADVLWGDDGGRAGIPAEEWTSQYGDYLFDGYFPDGDGRVVAGGPY